MITNFVLSQETHQMALNYVLLAVSASYLLSLYESFRICLCAFFLVRIFTLIISRCRSIPLIMNRYRKNRQNYGKCNFSSKIASCLSLKTIHQSDVFWIELLFCNRREEKRSFIVEFLRDTFFSNK